VLSTCLWHVGASKGWKSQPLLAGQPPAARSQSRCSSRLGRERLNELVRNGRHLHGAHPGEHQQMNANSMRKEVAATTRICTWRRKALDFEQPALGAPEGVRGAPAGTIYSAWTPAARSSTSTHLDTPPTRLDGLTPQLDVEHWQLHADFAQAPTLQPHHLVATRPGM
jgi:hypothetical protein